MHIIYVLWLVMYGGRYSVSVEKFSEWNCLGMFLCMYVHTGVGYQNLAGKFLVNQPTWKKAKNCFLNYLSLRLNKNGMIGVENFVLT